MKFKLFSLLWLAGMLGEVTLLWADLPLPTDDLPLALPVIKLLALLQSTIILSLAVFVGVAFASRVKLAAPFLESIAQGSASAIRALKKQVVPGIIGGFVSAGLVLAWFALLKPSLPPEFLAASAEFTLPWFVRILRGGISEEIVMRWGLMTLLVWLPWRILQRRQGSPRPAYVITAIGLSALTFGLLHLPAAFLLSSTVPPALVLYIIVGNALFGLIAGYLYWKTGLEAAILAHGLFHILIIIAQPG
ncbi:MAG: CPBP family intramembrane glutamic endopeptidase [Cyanobacteria bacterium P01_F01_bin.150]